MAEDMGKKMGLILTKPQYLDNIESRLNDFLTTVSSIEGKIAHLDHDVQVLQEKVKKTSKTVTELKDSADLKKDVKTAQYHLISLKKQLLYQLRTLQLKRKSYVHHWH